MRARRRAAVVVLIMAVSLGVTAPSDQPNRFTIRIVWDVSPPLQPVFDCSAVEVRRQYPMQCPDLGVPPLLGGGGPGGGGGACRGLCGLVDGVLKRIGLGGLLG